MKGPDFITTDGRRLALTWHRLKPSREVTAVVPQPGEASLSNMALAGAWKRFRDVEAGDGFDRRRFRVRVWRRTKPPKAWRVAGADGSSREVKPPPSWAPWASTLDEAVEPPVRYISLPLDRPWQAKELTEIEASASTILSHHHFPVGLDYPFPPLWRQIGEDMAWANWPGDEEGHDEEGHLEGEAVIHRITDLSGLLIDHGPLAHLWPSLSPFRWAQTVYRLARPSRLVAAELMAMAGPSRSAAAIKTLAASAFELGAALAEDTFRRLYDADLRVGQRAKKGRKVGSGKGAQKNKAKADKAWRSETLTVVLALRAKHPTWGAPAMVDHLFGDPAKHDPPAVANLPKRATVKAQIEAWMRDGTVAPTTASSPTNRVRRS